ncbi:MAG: TrmO family methyltransferase [Pseudomonadota bacterium]
MPDTARDGEQTLPFDPASAPHAPVTFIGRVSSPWSRGNCPKNVRAARERGEPAKLLIDAAYRPGLQGLSPSSFIIAIYWMAEARRDIIVQRPGHVEGPRGVFSLRSPVRPNSIAQACVQITAIDAALGVIEIDAMDCFDGTPLLDIKPWIATVDQPPADMG